MILYQWTMSIASEDKTRLLMGKPYQQGAQALAPNFALNSHTPNKLLSTVSGLAQAAQKDLAGQLSAKQP
jgi:hypothetical protein